MINEVSDKFIDNTLPTVSGDPDYECLNKIIQGLYSHVATYPTIMTGGKNGHVGLIMKDTMCAILTTGTPWEDSDNPGSIPTIATNYTSAHHQQANETYGKSC